MRKEMIGHPSPPPQKTQAMWQEFADLDFSGNTPNHKPALACGWDAPSDSASNIFDVDFTSATLLRQHQSDQDFLERVFVFCPRQ